MATGLTGTLGKKMNSNVLPANVILGTGKLSDYLDPKKEPITLIHFGGIVGESKVSQDLQYSKKINVDATVRLAQEVIEVFGGRFIHISSSHVYGPQESTITESTPYNPQSNYAKQKMLAEQELLNRLGQNHPQLVILRIFSVLGWDVADFTLGGAVNRILLGSDESIAFSDDIRDFMTPTSIAKAVWTVAEDDELSGIFNLCTGSGMSVGAAVGEMLKIKNCHEKLNQIKPGNSNVPIILGSNRKLLDTGLDLNLKWDPIDDLQ
jgi:nucleoside-diphosphate-sugar epimerase